jgi:hypothetical protein
MRLILIKCNANAHKIRIAQEYIFETKVMRLASWSWGGQSHIGIVSAQGHEVTALDTSDAAAGVLSLIERMVQGDSLPAAKGTRLPLIACTFAQTAARHLLCRTQLPRSCRRAGWQRVHKQPK